MITILGIDPGSRITGYGLISSSGQRHQFVDCGCIYTDGESFPARLQQIYAGINNLIQQYSPQEFAIEQVFMHQNASSALKLGQARGAAIVAGANHGLLAAEYSARQVKQSIVGYGAAKKDQIQHMICQILKLKEAPSTDAADALAIAMTHAHMRHSMHPVLSQALLRKGRIRH